MRTTSKLQDAFFLLVFLTVLTLPMVFTFVGDARPVGRAENRTLAPFPERPRTADDMGALPKQFEAWYNDHFGFRNSLVRAHAQLEYAVFGSTRRVIFGEDGWLFLERGMYMDMPTPPLVADLCGELPLGERELEQWVEALTDNWRRLDSMGVRYGFLLVPDKHSVYRDKLPRALRCDPAQTRRDQLVERLRRVRDFPLIDLTPALVQGSKEGHDLYYRTDSHWNGRGILVAWEVLHQWLGDESPHRRLLGSGRVTIGQQRDINGDVTRLAGLEGAILETSVLVVVHPRQVMKLPDPWPGRNYRPNRQPEGFRLPPEYAGGLSKALVFHDSFVTRKTKLLLAESFAESRFVWQGGPRLPLDLIEVDATDVVIHEMVERKLLMPFFRE